MADVDDLDLSSLAALDALLGERHVTRAAARLGITQSSMSHQLAKLRAHLGDPLLVRTGRVMLLTPRAAAMAEPLHRALTELRAIVGQRASFDPRTTTRVMTLVCPDLLAPLVPDVLRAMRKEAPHVGLEIVAPMKDVDEALASGLCDIALGATPDAGHALTMRSLGKIHWCVLARKQHPATRGAFTKAVWASYPHIVVRSGNASPNRVGDAIARARVTRRVGVTVPSFLAAPWIVASSDMLHTAPRELVHDIARALDLAVLTPPIALPAIPVAMLWHTRMKSDAGHAWFREVVGRTLATSLRVAHASSTRATKA